MLFVCRNIIHTTYGSLRDQQQQHKENGKIEGGHAEREGGTVRYIIDRNEENFREGEWRNKTKKHEATTTTTTTTILLLLQPITQK